MIRDPRAEALSRSLRIPSFESELARTNLRFGVSRTNAVVYTCKICGNQVVIGPLQTPKCPHFPHDVEDDTDVDLYMEDQYFPEEDPYELVHL